MSREEGMSNVIDENKAVTMLCMNICSNLVSDLNQHEKGSTEDVLVSLCGSNMKTARCNAISIFV